MGTKLSIASIDLIAETVRPDGGWVALGKGLEGD